MSRPASIRMISGFHLSQPPSRQAISERRAREKHGYGASQIDAVGALKHISGRSEKPKKGYGGPKPSATFLKWKP
jgi:hypothetical protein